MQRLRSVVLKCAPSSSLQLLARKEERKQDYVDSSRQDLDPMDEFGPEDSTMRMIRAEDRKMRKMMADAK